MTDDFSVSRKDTDFVSMTFEDSPVLDSLVERGELGDTLVVRDSSSHGNNVLVITKLREGVTLAMVMGLNFPINTIHCANCSVSSLIESLANSSTEDLLEMFNVKGTHREDNFLKYALCIFSTLRTYFDSNKNGGSLK